MIESGSGEFQLTVRRLSITAIILLAHSLFSGPCWADSWQNTVSSRIATEYETNPSMTPAYSGGVRRLFFEPSYMLMGSDGRNELRAGLALQIARSSNRTLSPDRDSPSVFLDWLRPSEAGSFGISTKYAEMATRDAGGVEATGRVPAASTRATRSLSGNWSLELSEHNAISANGTYEKISYKGGTFVNYATRAGGLKYSHGFSENTAVFVSTSGNQYIPTGGGPTSSLVDIALGLNSKTEYFDWTIQAGKSRVAGQSSDMQGSVQGQYTGERSHLALSAGRVVSPSGLGGFTKVDQSSAHWNYALSEYSNMGVDLDLRKNRNLTINNISSSAGVWLEHSLAACWKGRVNYLHRILKGGGVEGASSNILGISLAYSYSDL